MKRRFAPLLICAALISTFLINCQPPSSHGSAEEQRALDSIRALAQARGANQTAELNRLRQADQLDDTMRLGMSEEARRCNPAASEITSLLNSVSADENASTTDTAALRADLFYAATDALKDAEVKKCYAQSAAFKGALVAIFKTNFDAILKRGIITPDTRDPGYRPGDDYDNGLTVDAQNRLTEFFRLTLFTDPADATRGALIDLLKAKLNALCQASVNKTGAYDQISNSDGRVSPKEGALIAGELAALVANASKAGKDKNASAQTLVNDVRDRCRRQLPGELADSFDISYNMVIRLDQ